MTENSSLVFGHISALQRERERERLLVIKQGLQQKRLKATISMSAGLFSSLPNLHTWCHGGGRGTNT